VAVLAPDRKDGTDLGGVPQADAVFDYLSALQVRDVITGRLAAIAAGSAWLIQRQRNRVLAHAKIVVETKRKSKQRSAVDQETFIIEIPREGFHCQSPGFAAFGGVPWVTSKK
jgi:hypothetical protein